jgi:hypothetical protein
MVKSKIATVKSKMISTAKSLTPGQAIITNKKTNREENLLLSKVLLGAGKRPVGYRTYTNGVDFKRQMALDVADDIVELKESKAGHPGKWQNQQGFKIREAYKVKKWKDLSQEERDKWQREAEKEVNRDVEKLTS